jgi:pyridoxine kinase
MLKIKENLYMNLPRVAAVHDMSGFGKCSLTVALPVISACGVEVCPLPTALLSSSTNFEGFTILDFTSEMLKYVTHWQQLGLKFDAVYSGFLGSELQIEYIGRIIDMFSPKFAIIDPVMGDHGQIYKTYTPQMCENMRRLVSKADIVTPNLTEACILTCQDYNTVDVSRKGIEALAKKINRLGAKNVIITGIKRDNNFYNCVLTNNEYIELQTKYLPHFMNGTGDLFASVLTGGLLRGYPLIESVDSAAKFVCLAMDYSRDVEDVEERGAYFEPLLFLLKDGIVK